MFLSNAVALLPEILPFLMLLGEKNKKNPYICLLPIMFLYWVLFAILILDEKK